MKVVINTCFGGFGLSLEAEVAYLARKGKQAFFYAEDRESATKPGDRDLVRVDDLAEARHRFMTYTSTRDFGPRINHDVFWGKPDGTPDWYFYDREIDRDDPDLVAVVEELGEKASGGYSELAVVEIPDDVAWEIAEYDGLEHVAEKHRVWS